MKNYLPLVAFLVGISVGGGGVYLFKPPPPAGSEDPITSGVRLFEGTVVSVNPTTATFKHEKLGFSISYPKELVASEFDEGQGARTIVFQKPGEQHGFQMFVVPYSGDTITPERIQKDIPSGVVKDPVAVVIGNNIHATVFWSVSPSIGDSREAWFIHDGYLYEVTTYANLDTWLADILSTLSFE